MRSTKFIQPSKDYLASIYWVFTQVCNDKCAHCYNFSGPQGNKITLEDCEKIISNLPKKVGRIILSGGEPLAERKKLYAILDLLKEKYAGNTQIMLQTNGDLLNEEKLDTLIRKGVTRFDIASIDRFHKMAGSRLNILKKLFESKGVNGDNHEPLVKTENFLNEETLSWGYWGATEDMWLGGNWARGRALEKNVWLKNPNHNFCKITSGGIGFLQGTKENPQEISIQLWKINPCCPGTKKSMGDARNEKVISVLKRISSDETFQAINKGEPLHMGEHLGVTHAYAKERCEKLQNICLWCDEFFTKHYQPPKET